MTALTTIPNLDRPDDVYEALVRALDGLPPQDALRVTSRLVLLLANHIGDRAVVEEAVVLASQPTPEPGHDRQKGRG